MNSPQIGIALRLLFFLLLLLSPLSLKGEVPNISLSMFQRRLFYLGGVSSENAKALLVRLDDMQLEEIGSSEGAERIWRKWSFGEKIGTLTEVVVTSDEISFRNVVVRWNGEQWKEAEDAIPFRIVDADLRGEVIQLFERVFEKPIVISQDGSPSGKSGGGVDIYEEVFRSDEKPKRWGLRSDFLTEKVTMRHYEARVRAISRGVLVPSF
ncbi:hypothetical protein ACFQY0_20725 [Haloferula chungangensis]|uniref:POTRA domain-containing protein n=1 Tax=Haloferula chungangensis TaxID=1048331 RepID=A0ABW2LDN9_9BACT